MAGTVHPEQQRRIAGAPERARAMAVEHREKERVRNDAKDANDKVKRALRAMEVHGRLNELDALVAAVFPAAKPSTTAKAVAFVDQGEGRAKRCGKRSAGFVQRVR